MSREWDGNFVCPRCRQTVSRWIHDIRGVELEADDDDGSCHHVDPEALIAVVPKKSGGAHITIHLKDGSFIRADHWDGTMVFELEEIDHLSLIIEEERPGAGDSEVQFFPEF